MKNKKLEIALLTLAVFTTTQAHEEKSRTGLYQPTSTDTLVIVPGVEDAIVGAGSAVAEIVTLGHANTGNAPTGLLVAVPDVLPGVAKARAEKNSGESCSSKKKVKKECKAKQEKPAKVKKEKSCKKSYASTKKTKKVKNNTGHPAEVLALPVTVAADVVTLDTQHLTRETVDSINGNSDTENVE